MTHVADETHRSGRARANREVVSFVRRSARLSPRQLKAWDAHHRAWVLDVPRAEKDTSIDPDFSVALHRVFGREAPLVVEIGSGMGESLVELARDRPERNVLAFEVYQPAVARTLAKLARAEVGNVRIVQANAVEGLTTLVPPCSIDELWLFFPDPWHKAKHHKRRLVTPGFADLAASRMRAGARWRLATDWEDYAREMRTVLDQHPAFVNEHPGGWAPRWQERGVTRFEQRGIDAGRQIFELTFHRA